jgi:hypothetical protein
MPALVGVDETDSAAVRLARGALGTHGLLRVTAVDMSRGGIGLSSPVYLPPSCRLRLEVELPGGGEFKGAVRVHRAAMSDRKPTYYIGCAFEEADPARDAALAGILATLKGGADA